VSIKPPHIGPAKYAGGLASRYDLRSQFQGAIDYVTRVIQKGRQIIVSTLVIADVENVEGTDTIDLVHHRQVVWLDVLGKEGGILKAMALPALGGSIKAVETQLDALADEPESAFGNDL